MFEKLRIYLAGPMRGIPHYNMLAFADARKVLTDAGHLVYCPALLVQVMPYGEQHGEDRAALTHIIQMDLSCIYAADAIALLRGWQASRGVTCELAVAQFLGLKIIDALTMQDISSQIPKAPWSMIGSANNAPRIVKSGDWIG